MERPRSKEHGDYATNVALQLAKKAGMPPREFAQPWSRSGCAARRRHRQGRHRRAGLPEHHRLRRRPGPGGRRRGGRRCVVRRAARRSPASRINVEFISANPTGPLHLGHTRWAAVGDALARVWTLPAPSVDPGVLHQRPGQPDGQVRRLGRGGRARASRCRRTATTVPTSTTSRSRWSPSEPGILDLPEDERLVAFREAAYALQLAEQQEQLDDFRTHFDVWFSERSLHDERRRGREHREAPGPGPPLRRRRRAVDAHDGRSATTRTGC